MDYVLGHLPKRASGLLWLVGVLAHFLGGHSIFDIGSTVELLPGTEAKREAEAGTLLHVSRAAAYSPIMRA